MPKREAPASAQRPTQGKLKKKKHSLPCAMDVDAVVDKDMASKSGKKYTSNSSDGQGGQHEAADSNLSENSKECIMSAKGDPSQKGVCCLEAVENHLGVGLMQNTSEQTGNLKETGKGKKHAKNKGKQISNKDGAGHSSRAGEHSVGETEGTGTKIFNKSNVNSTSGKEGTPENANVISEKDSNCPEVKNTDLVENKNGRRIKKGKKNLSPNCSSLQENSEESKKPKKNNSPNCSSLQENLEEKKKPRRRRRGKKTNSPNKSTLQEFSLPVGADKAGLTTMAAENNMPGCRQKGSRKKKRNQNEVTVTKSFSIEDVNMGEGGKNVDVLIKDMLDGAIEKKDGVVPPGLSEYKKAEKDTKSLGSHMHDSKKVPTDDVPYVKANCLQSTSGEKVCQSALAESFTNRSNDGSKTGTSEGNRKMGPAERTEKASLPPSPIRGVIEDALFVLPMKLQHNQLDSLNEEGASFSFPVGEKAPEYGSDAHDYVKEVAFSSTDCDLDCISSSSLAGARNEKLKDVFSPKGSLIRFRRKKLLVLDLNGLLADINQDYHSAHKADAKVRGKFVFKRPYCDDFLKFCFEKFELGIWSSRKKENVDTVVNILMRDLKHNLLFCWDLSKCTVTGCKTLENMHKPLVLKELKKLWNKEEPDLPWEQGEYSPSNTLLVDDSPYKALRNPPHTAIFPYPYSYDNHRDDSLGPGGDLRVYLESLAVADDVECYVREHPFGQPSITESDPHWNFYVKIVDKVENTLALT